MSSWLRAFGRNFTMNSEAAQKYRFLS
jgi:hypothetical protein